MRVRFDGLFNLLGRQCDELLAVAPAAVNSFNGLHRHKHSAVKRCSGARQNPMHAKRQIIMRRAIIAHPVLQNDLVARLISQRGSNISADHCLQNLFKRRAGYEQSTV